MGFLPDSLLGWTKGFFILITCAIGSSGVLLYKFQTMLIYPSSMPPGSRLIVSTPAEHGMEDYEEVILLTPDGVKIRAFVILQPEKAEERPTVLLLHANAGNVGHRLPIAKVFYKRMRCNIVALSYRGYGQSEGTPNEKGIRLDANTILDHILAHPILGQTKIIVYGQSIGGAVGIDLASRNTSRISALVVENTFMSLPKLVPHVIPALAPFVFLMHQRWGSDELVPTFSPDFPVMYLSGARDELVPPSQMRTLFETSGGRKEFRSFESGTHNDTCMQPEYFATIHDFILRVTAPPPSLGTTVPLSNATSDDESYDLLETDGEDDIVGAGSRADVGRIAKEEIKEKLSEKL